METCVRWLVALIFFYAGVPKLISPFAFAEVIGAYGILPDPLVPLAAFLIPLAEVAGAVGLLLKRKWALHLLSCLVVLFILVLSYGIWLGLDIDCGCFGEEGAHSEMFSGLHRAVFRDLLLLLPLLFLYLRSYGISLQLRRKEG